MTAKEYLETVRRMPETNINLETGEGYVIIAPKQSFSFQVGTSFSFPRQFVKVLPYGGESLSQRVVTETIDGKEVEFREGPNYLVVQAPINPKGYPFWRIFGDFAAWSMTNSAPF